MYGKGGQYSEGGRRLSSQAQVNMMNVLRAQHVATAPEIVMARLAITKAKLNGQPITTAMRIAAGELPSYAINHLED